MKENGTTLFENALVSLQGNVPGILYIILRMVGTLLNIQNLVLVGLSKRDGMMASISESDCRSLCRSLEFYLKTEKDQKPATDANVFSVMQSNRKYKNTASSLRMRSRMWRWYCN